MYVYIYISCLTLGSSRRDLWRFLNIITVQSLMKRDP